MAKYTYMSSMNSHIELLQPYILGDQVLASGLGPSNRYLQLQHQRYTQQQCHSSITANIAACQFPSQPINQNFNQSIVHPIASAQNHFTHVPTSRNPFGSNLRENTNDFFYSHLSDQGPLFNQNAISSLDFQSIFYLNLIPYKK